jgi:type IV secretion system protein VirB9
MKLLGALAAVTLAALAGLPSRASASDSRLRTVIYCAEEVYRLRAYVGYQIDLEFESGESFVGMGAGDVEGLAFAAQGNHLFIKPKAANVRTNLTVLTTRRAYHFDYSAATEAPSLDRTDVLYALRFAYPAPEAAASGAQLAPPAQLALAQPASPKNLDYWYCGDATLQPVAAWDDTVHTHLRFSPRTELPALFVRNDDGSESLLNFNVEQGEMVVHRVAHQFVLRRGKLVGCVVNKGFAGNGAALESGTVTPQVERVTRETHDDAVR